MRKFCLAVVASGAWMNLSEFVRNEFVIKHVRCKDLRKLISFSRRRFGIGLVFIFFSV